MTPRPSSSAATSLPRQNIFSSLFSRRSAGSIALVESEVATLRSYPGMVEWFASLSRYSRGIRTKLLLRVGRDFRREWITFPLSDCLLRLAKRPALFAEVIRALPVAPAPVLTFRPEPNPFSAN